MNFIFIPGNVPSSKNSKTWTGKYLVSSKACQQYERNTQDYWSLMKTNFQEMFDKEKEPFKIGLYFVRKSKHNFDYINACQILADLMTKNEWIEDDNADFFLPVFLGYHHDKDNSGVYIAKVPENKDLKRYTKELLSEMP